MDKNSLILEIKNDLNSIKKQVEVTLAKIDVLEALIKLEVRSEELGISVQTSGEPSLLELSRVQPEITSGASNSESRDNACIVRDAEPEQESAPVAEPVEAPVEKLGVRSEELGVEELAPIAEPIETPIAEPEPEQEPESEIELEEEITPHREVELRNLMSVIGLNDRFRFRHDLFSNSDELFKETIDILNKIEDFDKAVDYLVQKFAWDEEDATVVYFYDIIKPKF